MGYRSDVVIAVHKTIVARDLIAPFIPQALRELPYKENDLGRYWNIGQWKWYDSYSDIQEIEAFFSELESMPPVKSDGAYDSGVYGAVRVGEDHDDIQDWGSPGDYDIRAFTTINYPFKNE